MRRENLIRKKAAALALAALLALAPFYAGAEGEPLPVPGPTPAPGEIWGESAGLETETVEREVDSILLTGGHKAYMNGVAGGYFLPDKAMTRAEAAQMLYNLLAAKPAVSSSRFPDVALTAWYGRAVNALAQAGVFAGYKDGTFGPTDTITRASFVTALSKCFTMAGATASFSDVPETHWAYPYIAAATSMGWIRGVGNGQFQPDRGITRAEAVTVMNAALGRTGEGFAADRDIQKFKDVPATHWAFLQVTEAAQPVADAATPTPTPTPTPDPSQEPTPVPGTFTVGQTLRVTASSGLNLRSAATTDSSVVTVLSYGTVLTVTSVSALPWLGVRDQSGRTGFVHSDYVENYTQGAAAGANLSASSLSLHQYQSARLDASVTSGLSAMGWTSSDPSVAVVGYTVNYGGNTQGAMVYGKSPGTATLTFSDAAGSTKASCVVTVTAPEPVRFAYASENSPIRGKTVNLVAVTDASRTSVTFKITAGPASGSYTASDYTTETRASRYGLPTNTVRVFKAAMSFSAAGTYTVEASANGAGAKSFTVLVQASDVAATTTVAADHRMSTEGLRVLANFEGSVPEIEDDVIASGNPTVGYGYVVPKNGTFYNNLTSSELWGLLVDKVNNGGYGGAVNTFRANNSLKMSQAQFDALVCFVYNCGSNVLSTSYDTPKVMLNAVAPPSGGVSESQVYPGTLNIDSSPLYQEASLSAVSLGTVPSGASVSVIGLTTVAAKKQVWYRVRYNSLTGWVPAGKVRLNGSGLVHDLAYADAATLSNNFLQWHKSGSSHIYGLLTRRLAECKIFFFGNYAEAYHSHANYGVNTYGFNYPSCEKEYE